MSYYSEVKYQAKDDLWFEKLYFNRWFKNNPGPILDIGCSTGNFIATHPEIIEGMEIDQDALKICRQRNLRVRALDADKDLSSLPADYYNGVYAKQIIEHLESPADFLRQVERILKPGGKAVILTPNCPYALKKFFWDDPTHRHPLTKQDLKNLAISAGFAKMKISEDFRCFPGLGRLMRLLRLSSKLVRRLQDFVGWRGLSLILEAEKQLKL